RSQSSRGPDVASAARTRSPSRAPERRSWSTTSAPDSPVRAPTPARRSRSSRRSGPQVARRARTARTSPTSRERSGPCGRRSKVAIVTGAGRGIGRSHALALARAGAKVVVNDLGAGLAGEGSDPGPAEQVVEEIRTAGGEASTNGENVADFAGAERLVRQAIDEFGRLDILVNNAGILRDRMLVNMTEDEWDAVITV